MQQYLTLDILMEPYVNGFAEYPIYENKCIILVQDYCKQKNVVKNLCICNCGKIFLGDRNRMFQGKVKSCGCRKNQASRDLTGLIVGNWKVLYRDIDNNSYWVCQCNCLRKTIQSIHSSRFNKIKGCPRCNYDNLMEKVFDRLKVINISPTKSVKQGKSSYSDGVYWFCKCECGNFIEVRGAALKSGNTRSCGCLSNEARRIKGKNAKEKNGNWNPNLTDEERMFNKTTSPEYKNWRISVLSRDNHQCVICGKLSNLEAHHKNGWSNFIEERFEVNNGVTLCGDIWKDEALVVRGCHEQFHSEYGYGNNTKEQFEEFERKYKQELSKG